MEAAGLVIVWLMLAVGVGLLADSRGRSFIGFFLLSAIFSPVLGLIVVLIMANKTHEDAQRSRAAQQAAQDHQTRIEQIRALRPAESSGQDEHSAMLDKLAKLADLRDRKVLSEQEFEAEKARLMGSRQRAMR